MVSEETGQAVVLLTVGIFLIQGMWLAVLIFWMYRAHLMKRSGGPPERASRESTIEDVFLLDRGGILLRHLTRRLRPHVDSGILSGMLRAVQEFVRDSFREEEGNLNEMGFGELKISLCTGKHVILATVVRGGRPADHMDQMMAAVQGLEDEHGADLRDWDGHMQAVRFVDEYLRRLLDGEYRSTYPDRVSPRTPPRLLSG